MPISDDAAQLGQMAEDGNAVVLQLLGAGDQISTAGDSVSHAADYVTTVAGQAPGIIGGTDGDQIAGLGNTAASAINDVQNLIQQIGTALDTAEQMVNLFFDALREKANKHGG